MNRHLVITLVGADRPGIVERLSRIVVEHGGAWEESHMANLGGQFAGILRIRIDESRLPALTQALQAMEGLQVSIAPAGEGDPAQKLYGLSLLGQDRPGIVHRVSAALAQAGASVEDMETGVLEASMSGEKLFQARIQLRLPDEDSLETLRQRLEDIADELIVDIELDG